MKELSIEEKAKRYDEAIERARVWKEKSGMPADRQGILDDIFPELKESEDEEVRKALCEYFKKLKDDGDIDETWHGFSYDKIIAWLEKQGELVNSLSKGLDNAHERIDGLIQKNNSLIEQLEKKQGENNMGISEATKQELEDNLNKTCKDEHKEKQYIIITQKILDYIGKHEWSFKNSTPKLGDSWKVIEICKYPSVNSGKPVVEVVNEGSGDWMRLPLNIVDIKIEHNFTDKVKPKFHEGEWVIDKQGIVHQIANVVENVTNHTYGYDIVGGGYFNDNTEGVRLWTIQDAKDGDVISFNDGHGNDCIELIKSITNKKIEFWFCLTNGNSYEVFDGIIPYTNLASRKGAILATQEQRDTLFAKIKEAGYEWDAEKKELKKINSYCKNHCKGYQETGKCFVDGGCKTKRDAEQKPAWSEEDRQMKMKVLKYLSTRCNVFEYEEVECWLKSLKERCTWKPSDEQMDALQYVYRNCNPLPSDKLGWDSIRTLELMYQDLKKLKG